MDKTDSVLESSYIDLDPICDGFEGVLLELCAVEDRYILTQTASATGNLLLRFTSSDARLAYALFAEQTGASTYRSWQ